MELFLASALLVVAASVPIDNDVVGYPEVTCGAHSIRLDVKTKRAFEGRIFVKGEAEVPGCSTTTHVSEYPTHAPPPQYPPPNAYGPAQPVAPYAPPQNPLTNTGYEQIPPSPGYQSVIAGYDKRAKRSVPGYGPSPVANQGYPSSAGNGAGGYGATGAFFELPLGHCNMRRKRTLYPRGVEYTYVAVVSFHPHFITKVDKAYRIRCFYMEAEKTLKSKLDVSMLTTAGLEQVYPMPVCQYHIKRDGYNGPNVRYAKVGDKVVHMWSCSQDAHYQFGLLVKNCYVDNGRGKKFQLIDNKGCSVDRHLISELEYSDKALKASVHAHVFKFADLPQLYFTCTVQLCVKSDGGCDGLTPPHCGYGSKPVPHYEPQYPPQPVHAQPPYVVAGPKHGPTAPRYGTTGAQNNGGYGHVTKPHGGYALHDAVDAIVDSQPADDEDSAPNSQATSDESGLKAADLQQRSRREADANATEVATKSSVQLGGLERGIVFNVLEAEIQSQPLIVLPFEDELLSDDAKDKLAILDSSVQMEDVSEQMCLTTGGFSVIVAMFSVLCLFSLVLSAFFFRGLLRGSKHL